MCVPHWNPHLILSLGWCHHLSPAPDHWQVALCVLPPPWEGVPHQLERKIRSSVASQNALLHPALLQLYVSPGMSYIFCKPDHQDTASGSPSWLGLNWVANNGQAHHLCSHSACSFAEDLSPVPGASTVILENSDGHCLLLSDTKYCAHAGVPHYSDAPFPRRS